MERKDFFENREVELGGMEKKRKERVFNFFKGEKRDRVRQGEERWQKIKDSRSNKWYQRAKKGRIPGY